MVEDMIALTFLGSLRYMYGKKLKLIVVTRVGGRDDGKNDKTILAIPAGLYVLVLL